MTCTINTELKNSQGRLISTNIFLILVTTLILIINFNIKIDPRHPIQIDNEFFVHVSKPVCQLIGYVLYCAGISMFYWMSVLCLDLYWTLTHLTGVNHHQEKSLTRFLGYLLFGCGVPIAQTIAIYLLDTFPNSSFVNPGIFFFFFSLVIILPTVLLMIRLTEPTNTDQLLHGPSSSSCYFTDK